MIFVHHLYATYIRNVCGNGIVNIISIDYRHTVSHTHTHTHTHFRNSDKAQPTLTVSMTTSTHKRRAYLSGSRQISFLENMSTS